MLILLALSTLLAEDLTCVTAGVLVATGQIGFIEATLACLAGIVVGDLGLYALGRIAGRRILELPLLKSRITADRLERASAWLRSRGAIVVFASRFTPGMRLPVYLAAGALRTDAVRFTLYFIMASAVWAPALIAASAFAGARWTQERSNSMPLVVVLIMLILVATRFFTWERRRRLLGMWRSFVRWEFWPTWAAYLPVLPWILLLAMRYRSLTLFTAANPGIESGGFAGESKSRILEALAPSRAVAPFTLIRRGQRPRAPENWPVVLKPDVGERGNGVLIAHDLHPWSCYLARATSDTIMQQYVPALEFGILYCRRPNEAAGRILSITQKCFPYVTGDGRRTLKQLILADDRAVCLASIYLQRNANGISAAPAEGERVTLVDIGSHCKGAVFVDARQFCTAALIARVDAISKVHPEFYLGRYDVRTPSLEHLQRGEFTVIELNGVTGEPTHIYDPAVSLVDAYRALFQHWRLVFEIGDMNRRRGHAPLSTLKLLRLIADHVIGVNADRSQPKQKEGQATLALE